MAFIFYDSGVHMHAEIDSGHYEDVYVATYTSRRKEREREIEIRPRLRGVWITLESGQAFVNGVSKRSSARSDHRILINPTTFFIPCHSAHVGGCSRWLAGARQRVRSRHEKEEEEEEGGLYRRWSIRFVKTEHSTLHVACCNAAAVITKEIRKVTRDSRRYRRSPFRQREHHRGPYRELRLQV